MTGGSQEKESPHDKQCPKCKLWYQDKGASFSMHAASCSGETNGKNDKTDSSQAIDTQTSSPDNFGVGAGEAGGSGSAGNPAFGGPGSKGAPTVSEKTELPCGHETFDPDDVPDSEINDGKTTVTCGKCGETRQVTL